MIEVKNLIEASENFINYTSLLNRDKLLYAIKLVKTKPNYYQRMFNNLNKKVSQIKPILMKRKTAFTLYEWLKIKDTLNLNE